MFCNYILRVTYAELTDTVILIFLSVLILLLVFGQNWRSWYARRQIRKALRKIKLWKKYGVSIIKKEIAPYLPSSVTEIEAIQFIEKMIEFFVINPTKLDPPIFPKIRFLVSQKNTRYKQLIEEFLPKISETKLNTVMSLIQATSELNEMFKEVQHDLTLGKKIRSAFYVQQTASKITQVMLNAQSYRKALDTFRINKPIGDSIGPMSIKAFVKDRFEDPQSVYSQYEDVGHGYISYSLKYKGRECLCLRAKGPASNVGNPGAALNSVFEKLSKQDIDPKLIVTIDAFKKLEGEETGIVNQGIGALTGGEGEIMIDKFQIETIALQHEPQIPIESITCKESLDDAVSPINVEIRNSIPVILRVLKKIVRTQSQKGDKVIIMGIGNALGVKNA